MCTGRACSWKAFSWEEREQLHKSYDFLLNSNEWREEISEENAKKLNITLSDDHLVAIHVARICYAENDGILGFKDLFKKLEEQKTGIDPERLDNLFKHERQTFTLLETIKFLAGLPK